MPPLILGAGPAGCAAAIALAEAGAAPVLLDRDAQVRDQLCGGFLSWRTAATLRGLGVDPTSLGARTVETLALFAGSREVALPLPEPAFGLSRGTLDAALRRRAVATGARLEIDAARGIEGTTVLGRACEWRADALFLATGKHDLRGLARPRRSADPSLGLRLRLPPTAVREALLAGRIELHLFAKGYAGIVLQEDGSANVCLAVRKSLLTRRRSDPKLLLEALAEANPAFARRLGENWGPRAIETVGAVPYGWIARATEPGLFRLGDQAAVMPSLAGEGIAIALASGAMAARHWLARGAQGAPSYQRELASRVAGPMRAAGAARSLAESRLGAAAGFAVARAVPAAVRWLMQASRIGPEARLAQPRLAP